MRNLQKILALVLALVMSLSLMATAGATDFTDNADIDETFAESVDVLNGLEVFQGYPTGDFQPKGEITRAEVAAIIYRIATGDVSDSQVGIYADYNKFSDVYASEPMSGWAAGYINYCANAEYVKGRGNGKFDPAGKVTGYEALAMILRVVGYDKNGEFTGSDWAVQTAAIANQRHVTDNINAGMLGQPATREMVAEILCKAILLNTVNYTLAYGYQISTNDQDTIAYKTFKMEQLEGVVTGNEIADLKTDKGTALGANQTRLVIDGREEVMNIPTGLDDIGERVRVYIRPENGTTRSNLVTSQVYSDGLNKIYTTSERVSSVGDTTGSSEGITSIKDAEHFINFDQAHKYEARSVIRYVMDVRMSEYEAKLMFKNNGGDSLAEITPNTTTGGYDVVRTWTGSSSSSKSNDGVEFKAESDWDKLIRVENNVYNYRYIRTIKAFDDLTDTDYNNIRTIFTNGDYNVTPTAAWTRGEVYVGTSSIAKDDDISDDIRWEDFIKTYLQVEENKEQVDSNGQGCWLKIIDNDNDGIAEYVLQTRYTVAKVAANGTGLDIAAMRFTDGDTCNEVTASEKITVVSGTNLENSEDTLAAGDVVIYAKIDGKIRAQKAETETSRVTSINRAVNPLTATIESGEKKESWVHEHSDDLGHGLTNMVIGTNYTVYFDLYGNIAAFEEGNVGSYVLITDGWFNQTATAREWAVQAYIDGALQTVNITNNGDLFIQAGDNNNKWGMLKTNFGGTINSGSTNVDDIHTIVANIEGSNLVPVDKTYTVNHTVRMLDMKNNAIPNRNGSKANAYETAYGANATAYTVGKGEVDVFGRSDTVYYYVYKDNTTNYVTGQPNIVVRQYTGCDNTPSINSMYIEDVYAVGRRVTYNDGTINPNANYTADVVVVELNHNYKYTNTNRDQVFIPGATIVNNEAARTSGYGIESVPMILNDGTFKEDVQVDLTHSTGYNAVNNSITRIEPGLYYLDPVDTNSTIHTIHRMSAADIRANYYLTGYVSQDTIMESNYVRVDVQMPVYNIDGVAIGTEQSGDLKVQSKTVNTENLYTLSYSNNVASLVKAPATTVFDQWKDRTLSNPSKDKTNELYNVATDSFLNTSENRNEVLVRYNGNSVVWAISFAEKNGSAQNYAQDVWFNNLIARDNVVSSNVAFYGVPMNDDVRNQIALIDRVDANGNYYITVNYADAAMSPVIDLTNAYAATIKSRTLTKWDGNDYSYVMTDAEIANETKENSGAQNGTVKYRLDVTFVSGGSETYYLTLNAANSDLTVKIPASTGTVTGTYLDVADVAMTIQQFINIVNNNNPGKTFSNWKFQNRTSGTDITDFEQGQMIDVGTFSFVMTAENGQTVNCTGICQFASVLTKRYTTTSNRAATYLKDLAGTEYDQVKNMLDDAYTAYLGAIGTADRTKRENELKATIAIAEACIELMDFDSGFYKTHDFDLNGATSDVSGMGLNDTIARINSTLASKGITTVTLNKVNGNDLVNVSETAFDSVGNRLTCKMRINVSATEGSSTVTKDFTWAWKLLGVGEDASDFGTMEEIDKAIVAIDDPRSDYADAYALAGMTMTTAKSTDKKGTITVSVDKDKFDTLLAAADNRLETLSPEMQEAVTTMKSTEGGTVLYYGVSFKAPAKAQSVRITEAAGTTGTAITAGDSTSLRVKGGATTSGLGFVGSAVHAYVGVANNTTGSYASTISSTGKTVTYHVQFYLDAAGTIAMGSEQVFTLTINAPAAPQA